MPILLCSLLVISGVIAANGRSMASGEIILIEVRIMNDVMEAGIAGAALGAGTAIWLLAGYLIQRFAFRNPEPSYATVLATSMSVSMLLFSLGALLALVVR